MYKIFLCCLTLLSSAFWQQASSSTLPEEQAESSSSPKPGLVPQTITDQLMYCTVRIETDQGVGTGFRFDFPLGDPSEKKTVPCLVTNKHVVKGATEAKFHFHGTIVTSDKIIPSSDKLILELKDIENRVILHPKEEIDLCVIPFVPIIKELEEYKKTPFMISLNKTLIPTEEDLKKLSAVEDVLMVGYPTGLYDSVNNFPIFRKGITSTHPAIDFNGKPEFMIDAACFPGSSGSPVFIYNAGIYSVGHNNIVAGGRLLFLGILHSGPQMTVEGKIVTKDIPTQLTPFSQSNVMLNLGYVIKASQLDAFRIHFEKTLKTDVEQ